MKDNQSKYLKVTSVADRYEVGVSTVWARVKKGELPSPYKFGDRCTRWKSSELDEFDLQNKVDVAQ